MHPSPDDEDPAGRARMASNAGLRVEAQRLERDNARLRAILGVYGVDPDANYGGTPAHSAILAAQAVIAAGILLDDRYADAWPWLRQAIAGTDPETALRATQGPRMPRLVDPDLYEPPGPLRPSEGVEPSSDLWGDDPVELDRIEGELHTGHGPMMANACADVMGQIVDLLPDYVDAERIASIAVRAAWPRAGAAAIRDTATVIELVSIPPFSKAARRTLAQWMRHTADRREVRSRS